MQRLKLPQLEKTKSIITAHDYDEYNFLYTLLRSKYPQFKNSFYTKLKSEFLHKFNLSNVCFPITPCQLEKFIRQNEWLDIKLCVLNFFENKFYPNQILGTGKQRMCVVLSVAFRG